MRLALACLLLAATPALADGLAGVKARGELRWGGDVQGGEPYVYEDPASPGKLVGFGKVSRDLSERRSTDRAGEERGAERGLPSGRARHASTLARDRDGSRWPVTLR